MFRRLVGALGEAAARVPVLVVAHPQARAAAERAGGWASPDRLRMVEPLDPSAFLSLAARASMLVSDSGEVAEIATVLKRPMLMVRRSTDRPEAVDAGFARLITCEDLASTVEQLYAGRAAVLADLAVTPSPYGDGSSPNRIAGLILAAAVRPRSRAAA
jgi:UDP-N-acetylglucosamine 2-epimerase (non-hydrolysing)